MPRLSVIMPVRNAHRTIRTAVRSTLLAMPRDAELLVYNDASTDQTPQYLESIRDRRVRILHGSEGLGVAKALNLLLGQVDSELIARMDSDDVCLPWRFTQQLRPINDGMQVVFSTVVYFGGRKVRPIPWRSISAAAFPLQLLVANPVAHSTMLGRLDAVHNAGAYRDLPSEDYDLWLRLAAKGAKMIRIGLPCLLYRIHEGQVTSSASWQAEAAEDQRIVESYRALARQQLNQDPDWYSELRAARRNRPILGSTEPLTRLLRAVDAASTSLPPKERRRLLAKCRAIVAKADE